MANWLDLPDNDKIEILKFKAVLKRKVKNAKRLKHWNGAR